MIIVIMMIMIIIITNNNNNKENKRAMHKQVKKNLLKKIYMIVTCRGHPVSLG